MTTPAWIDLAFAAVLVISLVVGALRGFVHEMLSLLGWVVAYVAARLLATTVAPWLPGGWAGGLRLALAGLGVFVVVLFAWGLVAWLIRRAVTASPLRGVDRGLGGMFGLARGALVAMLAAAVVAASPLSQSGAWQASLGARAAQRGLALMRPLLPFDLQWLRRGALHSGQVTQE